MPNWSRVAVEMLPHGYSLSWQPHLLWLAAGYQSKAILALVEGHLHQGSQS